MIYTEYVAGLASYRQKVGGMVDSQASFRFPGRVRDAQGGYRADIGNPE